MRRILCLLFCLLPLSSLRAQDEEILRAARYLSGAASDEEVDEYWLSRLETLQGRRIRINDARPRAEGLLSDYQLASLADYRSTSGDILSWEELALVDGFSQEWVRIFQPFLSLASDRLPGAADTVRVRGYTLVRATLNNVGIKARANAEHWRAGAAWRGRDGTFHAEGTWRGHRLLAGDFNLRFGQGAALWSGFSLESLSTPDAFIRRASGITPVWSYTSGNVHRGIAYEYTARHARGSVFGTLRGDFGGHADWLGRYGQAGFSALFSSTAGAISLSMDTRWNWRGADYVGEVAWRNRSLGGKVALRFPAGPVKLALQARVLPRLFTGKKYGEYALAGGCGYKSRIHQASLTVDAALLPIPEENPSRLQIRSYALWQWQFAPSWALDLRATERYRNYEKPRTDIRADVRFSGSPWNAGCRLDGVRCEKLGFLGYLEGGYRREAWYACLRLTGFAIERWNDRIYCYERDAPGTFSVPAYSGNGFSLAATGSWKYRFPHVVLKAYLRASWMVRAGRTPAPGLNLQLHCDLR